MKDNYSKTVLIKILNEIGLEAEQIPSQRNVKTPDIKAWHGKEQYIIEFKIKSDDLQEIRKEGEAFKQGEIVHKETPLGPRTRLYTIISDGVKQVVKYDPQHDAFHIIWLHSSGNNDSLLNMRFHATLFGAQDLFSIQRKGLMTCYYFKESSFFSHRSQLDGAILTYKNKLQLCVNSLSPGYQSFSQSFLYQALSSGLCDPGLLVKKEDTMIADCDLSRKNEDKILNYLKEKYTLTHLQTINMKQYSAKVALPDKGSK